MPRLLLLLLLPLLTGCYSNNNFSQVSGFDEIRASLSKTPPDAAEQALLRQYQPQLYIAANSEGPLDFYRDYIGSGVLTVGDTVIRNPTAAQLNQHKNNPAAVFVHHSNNKTVAPVAYGGVHYGSIDMPAGGAQALTFLSYHFAFRTSGLPAGISDAAHVLANLVGDSEDWHQLDHYTAVYVVLADNTPRAVMLQQHNHIRTYFIGGAEFPADVPLAVDAAISSNEFYPHSSEHRQHRSAGFLNADTIDYLLHLEDDGGIYTGNDITHGARQVQYALEFLPPDDAFYVFEGWLGERRLLPGRDGPPGAIYRMYPQLWELSISLPVFYWYEKDTEYSDIMKKGERKWRLSDEAISRYQKRFGDDWVERFGE